MLAFFANLSFIEFQVRNFASFRLFSVIGGFKWFWMESLHKNIQSRMEFPLAPFLVLHFSCYTLMTFLMMLSVIFVSVLVIEFICAGDRVSSLYSKMWLGIWSVGATRVGFWGTRVRFWTWIYLRRKWLVALSAGKSRLVSFDRSNNTVAIDMKMDGSVLGEISSFKMLGLSFSFKLDWGSYIISIAKTAPKKIGTLICFNKYLSHEVDHTALGWCS